MHAAFRLDDKVQTREYDPDTGAYDYGPVQEYLDEEEDGYDEYGHETAIMANAKPGSLESEEHWVCWDCVDTLILQRLRLKQPRKVHSK